jgi:hypothetical protein
LDIIEIINNMNCKYKINVIWLFVQMF